MVRFKRPSILAIALVFGTSAGGQDAAIPAGPRDNAARVEFEAQQLLTRKARLTADVARLHRELAELAIQEYAQVTYPRELAVADAAVARTRAERDRVEDRLIWERKLIDPGLMPKATQASDTLIKELARFAFEQATTEREVLTQYTREQTLQTLSRQVDAAREEERIREAAWQTEQDRLKTLARRLPADPV